MKDSKLISARIEKDTLNKIDDFCKERTFWTRNYVINQILSVVMTDFDYDSIYDIVRRSWCIRKPIEAKYKI